ncbi:MAG: RHS repeat-associated core domain-containing protein [Chloroflexota bacterium]|nr:RHS repeat-associated core domain-containing protein [Chloroflexota bacterium]MDQ5865132.1 RHS repeat-associated core domain-containing protein [Chloroflexota bacterium]
MKYQHSSVPAHHPARECVPGTNQSGGEVGRQQYDAWGKVRPGGNVTQTKLNYTGQRKDDTGLHYYHARYYDSSVGMFNSPDSVVPGGMADPQAFSQFSGMCNNPVNLIDPTGHEFSIPPDLAVF